MSLFDVTDLVTIKLYYIIKETELGKKLIILEDEKVEELLKDEERKQEVELLETQWKSLNWKEDTEVMRVSTSSIDAVTGTSGWNFYKYRDSMVKKCLKKWNLRDDEENEVPVTEENIDNLPSSIILGLYDKFNNLINYTDEDLKN